MDRWIFQIDSWIKNSFRIINSKRHRISIYYLLNLKYINFIDFIPISVALLGNKATGPFLPKNIYVELPVKIVISLWLVWKFGSYPVIFTHLSAIILQKYIININK